jgi:hypothetical protein
MVSQPNLSAVLLACTVLILPTTVSAIFKIEGSVNPRSLEPRYDLAFYSQQG